MPARFQTFQAPAADALADYSVTQEQFGTGGRWIVRYAGAFLAACATRGEALACASRHRRHAI